MPQTFSTLMQYGCPYDCGLCPDHMQHSCLSIVEVNDHCNLNCPILHIGQPGLERALTVRCDGHLMPLGP